MRRYFSCALDLLAVIFLASCGDDDVLQGGPPPTATPGGPPLGTVQCDPSPDTCAHAHTQLLAISHAFVDPANTVYYRVTVPAAPTGTDWGDPTNGFFYQAVVNGGTPSTYVPFNGMAVGDDNRPMLPPFSFIVAANVAKGEPNTTLEIDLCATDYAGGTATVPPCTKPLWTDTYAGLPVPAVGLGPADDPFNALTPPNVLFDAETGSSVAVPNNGVYPGVLEVCPTLDGSSCAELSESQLQWFYDHLVFFGLDGEPYTNNVSCSVARRQLTTPSHPQPTDCLGTADAGPILTSRYQELVWEADGHLVFYDATHAFIWKAGNLTPGDNLCYQGDGNLVIYSNGTAVWASGTDDAHHGGNGGVLLAIIEPCQFVILDASGSPLLETIQSCPP